MAEFIPLTSGLRDLGGRRVWSLMISLFGDLAQEQSQVIDGPLLHAIMAGLMIKPEAARVALHRLRNDGWITSQKSGRISQHRLSSKGHAESVAASPRIYAKPALPGGAWQVVLTQEEMTEEMRRLGFTPVMPRVFVGSAAVVPPANTLSLPANDAPDWLRAEILPPDLTQSYAALRATLQELNANLASVGALSQLEIAILRCLIVHNWRRLVLKHPALPPALIDPDGALHQCHLLVDGLLTRFARPALRNIQPQSAAA